MVDTLSTTALEEGDIKFFQKYQQELFEVYEAIKSAKKILLISHNFHHEAVHIPAAAAL